MILKVFLAVTISLGMLHQAANASDSPKKSALMFGTVVSARYIENINDENENESEIYLGAIYEARLRKLEVLHGGFDQNSITVRLVASNKGYLKRQTRILIYVEFNDASDVSFADWWRTESLVCVTTEDIKRYQLNDAFDGAIRDAELSCLTDQSFE